MADFIRKHWTYLLGALLLHVLFAGIFGLTMISMARQPPPAQLAIKAVIVDQSVLTRAARRSDSQRQRERERAEQQQRQQQEERQRQEQQAQQRKEAEQRAEQERRTELKQREEAEQRRQVEERQERERAEAQRKRQADEQRKRQAEEQRKKAAEIERRQKEEAEKRRAADEARAQAAREEELRSQLQEEEGVMQAESSGLLDQYRAMIYQRIVRNWNRPPSAQAGLACELRVTQTPSGTVLSVQLGKCNGDTAVKQSIEAAVMRSSPLPPPPDPRLFQRTLVLIFQPTD